MVCLLIPFATTAVTSLSDSAGPDFSNSRMSFLACSFLVSLGGVYLSGLSAAAEASAKAGSQTRPIQP